MSTCFAEEVGAGTSFYYEPSHQSLANYSAADSTLGLDTTGVRAPLDISSDGSGSRFGDLNELLAQIKNQLVSVEFLKHSIALTISLDENTETSSPPTIAEKLDQIRDTFGLSMSALAKILGASRASLYNWYDSAPRNANKIRRIETLYELAQEWQKNSPFHYAPGKLMKQKLGNGPSMLERLGSEELDTERLQAGFKELLILMEKQRQRMDRAKKRSAKASISSDSHKEVLERITGSVTTDN